MTQRRSKYNAKKTKLDGYTFDSKAEARRYSELVLLVRAGAIAELTVHPRFLLQTAFADNKGKWHRPIYYVADFMYTDPADAVEVVEDVKGHRTAVFRIKEKLFRRQNSHIDLRILDV